MRREIEFRKTAARVLKLFETDFQSAARAFNLIKKKKKVSAFFLNNMRNWKEVHRLPSRKCKRQSRVCWANAGIGDKQERRVGGEEGGKIERNFSNRPEDEGALPPTMSLLLTFLPPVSACHFSSCSQNFARDPGPTFNSSPSDCSLALRTRSYY